MKIFRYIKWLRPAAIVLLIAACKDNKQAEMATQEALPAGAVPNALPFTMEFVQKNYNWIKPLPRLQSYVFTTSQNGYLLIVGGRRQGLHTFEPAPATNFIADSSNNYLVVINPADGQFWYFDVNTLPAKLSAPLQATNQQAYHDRASDYMYIVGGYGWNAQQTNMLTFGTIIRFKVEDLVDAIMSPPNPQKIASLMQIGNDDRFAVTGGELTMLGSNFYLVFGQRFDGQYRAFGGSDFQQKYTEEFRVFNLVPGTLKINSYGATTNTDPDRPFHRRDGNITDDIDPASGQLRIAAFGGVFLPGIIGAYTNPVYITGPGSSTVDRSASQKFNQYECPVITAYDSTSKTVYHTFFGGISHYYYFQTPSQDSAYKVVTQQGRNDGFPFVADITTLLQSADGTYKEYIHTSPTPGNRLVGASVNFIINPKMMSGYAYDNGVIKLGKIANGARLSIGYIYGGIEAQNPLPLIPNTGTFVSNSVFEVFLTNKPSAAIPADQGHESTKNDANLQRK